MTNVTVGIAIGVLAILTIVFLIIAIIFEKKDKYHPFAIFFVLTCITLAIIEILALILGGSVVINFIAGFFK